MSLSDPGVDVSRCSSLVVFAALFRRLSTKMAILRGIQADASCRPQTFKAP
jgi:hypothetical protein